MSSWKIKKQLVRGIRTHDLTRQSLKYTEYFVFYDKKFSAKKKQKNSYLKKSVFEILQKMPKYLSFWDFQSLDLNHSESIRNNFSRDILKIEWTFVPPCLDWLGYRNLCKNRANWWFLKFKNIFNTWKFLLTFIIFSTK